MIRLITSFHANKNVLLDEMKWVISTFQFEASEHGWDVCVLGVLMPKVHKHWSNITVVHGNDIQTWYCICNIRENGYIYCPWCIFSLHVMFEGNYIQIASYMFMNKLKCHGLWNVHIFVLIESESENVLFNSWYNIIVIHKHDATKYKSKGSRRQLLRLSVLLLSQMPPCASLPTNLFINQ